MGDKVGIILFPDGTFMFVGWNKDIGFKRDQVAEGSRFFVVDGDKPIWTLFDWQGQGWVSDDIEEDVSHGS